MSTTAQEPYNWAADGGSGMNGGQQQQVPPQPSQPPRQQPRPQSADGWDGGAQFVAGTPAATSGRSRHTHRERTYNVNVGVKGGQNGGQNGGGGAAPAGAGPDRHQGDRMIYAIERIEFRSDKDILALAKAINHLGRELHLILGMRAEELNGVLSQYKGHWYTFGASSRVKARLVSAHLKISAEAAKALGVGALKMAYAFNRHFVKPEQDARQRRNGKTAGRQFRIGDE